MKKFGFERDENTCIKVHVLKVFLLKLKIVGQILIIFTRKKICSKFEDLHELGFFF